uniref:Cathepsin propeptide inhibitor domain-containing protein n=1 Tax=Oryza barthii TaxID=65489 RepID=A0A0D3FKQ7_9ORYZ
MLLVSLPVSDTYEQETRQMFVEWKAKYMKTYRYAGEEECRYTVFKRAAAASPRPGLPGRPHLASTVSAPSLERRSTTGRKGQKLFKQETHRMFVGWKAKYDKTYRDVGEENCQYRLFMGNHRVVIRLNTTAGQHVYGLNQFGNLTNGEVQERCYPEMEDQELIARCQTAVPIPDPGSEPVHGRLIR